MNALQIEGLNVHFASSAGNVIAVRDFSLTVRAGECVGVVGESGAGKSQAFLAVIGLLPKNARVSGSARFGDVEMIGRKARELDRIRGAGVTMVFQDPLTSLTPHLKIGDQLAEPLVRHQRLGWKAARARALELLTRVHVTDPAQRLKQYPHELSGGMRQRVMIAAALACDPTLVIADEPTTALDVTIQAQILALLAELQRERGMSMVLITHDLGVIAGIADRVAVMQAGRIVEQGETHTVFRAPTHPHTKNLLATTPRLDDVRGPVTVGHEENQVLLELSDLHVHFSARSGWVGARSVLRAVDGVDLTVGRGEAVGIVGESGSGKSTLARAVLRLLKPTSGRIVWLGRALENLSAAEMKPLRSDLQVVFQDPLASLDPRMTVGEIVSEPLRVHQPHLDRTARRAAVTEILRRVALAPELLRRYPHELSGGQCQRVGIARAMVLKPKLLICDEILSALDVTTQAQIMLLIEELRRESGLALLFISHNLAIVRKVCERVLVLYLGHTVELAATERIYDHPIHPYTRALIAAIPALDPTLARQRTVEPLSGEPPSAIEPPSGCVFRTRCPWTTPLCASDIPRLQEVQPKHWVACHHWKSIPATAQS